jgi:hypothetical protein
MCAVFIAEYDFEYFLVMSSPGDQFVTLLILSIPVACVSWTVTHEEVFRELREFCKKQSQAAPFLRQRKFFYLLTCEYCFSHYISAAFIALSRFQLLLNGWRGYFIAWLSVVWISNAYLSVFGRLRLDIKHERLQIASSETESRAQEREAVHRDVG